MLRGDRRSAGRAGAGRGAEDERGPGEPGLSGKNGLRPDQAAAAKNEEEDQPQGDGTLHTRQIASCEMAVDNFVMSSVEGRCWNSLLKNSL